MVMRFLNKKVVKCMYIYQMTHIMNRKQFTLYCHDFSLFVNRVTNIRKAEHSSNLSTEKIYLRKLLNTNHEKSRSSPFTVCLVCYGKSISILPVMYCQLDSAHTIICPNCSSILFSSSNILYDFCSTARELSYNFSILDFSLHPSLKNQWVQKKQKMVA